MKRRKRRQKRLVTPQTIEVVGGDRFRIAALACRCNVQIDADDNSVQLDCRRHGWQRVVANEPFPEMTTIANLDLRLALRGMAITSD